MHMFYIFVGQKCVSKEEHVRLAQVLFFSLHVCVCVCMYIYEYFSVHLCVYVYVCVRLYMCGYVHRRIGCVRDVLCVRERQRV